MRRSSQRKIGLLKAGKTSEMNADTVLGGTRRDGASLSSWIRFEIGNGTKMRIWCRDVMNPNLN
jgi:hypothetical protein